MFATCLANTLAVCYAPSFFFFFIFESLFLLDAAARRKQLVSRSVREETLGYEGTTATLWGGGGSVDFLWSEDGLPARLLRHFSLHS